jgi:hypothetical protein
VGHTAGATAAPDGQTITIMTVEIVMMHWMGLAKVTYSDFLEFGHLGKYFLLDRYTPYMVSYLL